MEPKLQNLPELKKYLESGGDPNARDGRGRTLLHYAVKTGVEAVRLLLQRGADPNAKDRRGRTTPLHYAAMTDDEVIIELVKAGADVNARDRDGRTPLHWAVAARKNVETLLYHGADPNMQDKYGNTPLHYAVMRRNDYDARRLLEYFADPRIRNKKCMSPIDLARKKRFYELVELMEEDVERRRQAAPKACTAGRRTQLHEAVARCNPEEVEKLLYPWIDRDVCDEEGKTPLHYAVMCGDNEKSDKIIKMFLRPWPRASPNVKDIYGRTPLHYAVLSKNTTAVKILLEHGADPTVKDNEGKTPLDYAREHVDSYVVYLLGRWAHIWRLAASRGPVDPDAKCYRVRCSDLHKASRFGYLTCVKNLLDAGADPNARDKFDKTPLHYAAEEGHVEAARALLDRGADPNVKDFLGFTPLHYASMRGRVEVVKLLLERGVDPNLKTVSGDTPLHVATEHCDVVKLLLQHGADPNARNSHGHTPLHFAAVIGTECSVEQLLRHGADPNVQGATRDTPLHIAGNEKIASILAERVMDVNTKNNKGQIPLHLAAERGYTRVIQLLLERGADVNASDNEGNTPLHYAAKMCRTEATKLLLKYGADPTAKNSRGESPIDLARRQYEKYRGYCNTPYSCWTYREEIENCAVTVRILESAKNPT